MVALALLSVPMAVVAEVNHLAALRLLGSAEHLASFTPATWSSSRGSYPACWAFS